jgi:hypothetical protein
MVMRVEVSQRLPKQPQRIAASNGVFEAAISLHRQGHLLGAEQMYEAQLNSIRNHFDALHNLGLLSVQQRQLEKAGALICDVPLCAPADAFAGSGGNRSCPRRRSWLDSNPGMPLEPTETTPV